MAETSVLIVGAGPVGLLLTLSLSQADVPVTILDVAEDLNTSTKSIAYQPFLFPLFEKLGIMEDLKRFGALNDPPQYRSTKTGEVVLQLPKMPGGKGILVLPQSRVMEALRDGLRKKNVEVLWGHRLTQIEQSGDGVTATAETSSGSTKTFAATYVIGADGGRSSVRKLLDIKFEGETLPSQCVACDVQFPFEKHGFSDSQFLIDPQDFGLVGKIGKEDAWRVSFSAGNDATMKEIEGMLSTKFDAMFPKSAPRPLNGNYKILNVAPYKCQQLCAETMRKGRVCLVGDAAHLTNPYGGIGVTTGFFDAASLSQALVSILKQSADPLLLDAWSQARINVFKTIVDPHSRAGFFRVQDKDPETLPQRDKMFMAIKAGKMPPPLGLATDVTTLEGYVA